MSGVAPLRVERASRRRGAFGLDARRRPDPVRVEGEIREYLAARLPDAWALPPAVEAGPPGRTIVLLLSRGHVAVLRIEPDRDAAGAAARTLVERCRAQAIPMAVVESLTQARAALRRFGIEPRPCLPPALFPRSPGRCRAKPSS